MKSRTIKTYLYEASTEKRVVHLFIKQYSFEIKLDI